MYIHNGCLTSIYSIRLKNKRIRSKNDPYIWISMSCKKRIPAYLNFFTNEIGEEDSFVYQQVRERLNRNPTEQFYVKLIGRFRYGINSRSVVSELQNNLDSEISYPDL